MFLTTPEQVKELPMNKKMVSAGLAAGLLAGTGAGLILQMTGTAGAAGSSTAAVSVDDTTDSGTPADDATAQADRTARLQEVLQPLVDDGSLTQDQLDKVISTLDAAGPMGGDHGGRGPGGPGGPGGHHGDRDGDAATDGSSTDSGSIDGGPADSTATTEA
ncbi:MAG: hypothetical protein ABMA25_12215 [Ilumatobacteraceae bacterium]